MNTHLNSPPLVNKPVEGLVVTHLGKSLAVETPSGEILLCQSRRQLGMAAVGDRVLWEPVGSNQGYVIKILPRRTLLSRPGRNGRSRAVAANLDQLLIVFSVQPDCDFLLIDQYLVFCENNALAPVLLFNKIDLDGDGRNSLEQSLAVYADLGYPILRVSSYNGQGLDELRRNLRGHSSILVGQSGVGKSSLTNTLLPDRQLRVNELSSGSGHGRHTTTTATLYHLPEGGNLIDSPGVAIFGLDGISEEQLATGYREFREAVARCQFNDCRHQDDKGCSVRSAVEAGEIHPNRYQRFLKLREKLALPRR